MRLKEKLKRLGIVRVANAFILNDPQAAIAVFEKAGFLPLAIKTVEDGESEWFEYFGYSHNFEEVPEGSDIYPYYQIEADTKGIRVVDVRVRLDKAANE